MNRKQFLTNSVHFAFSPLLFKAEKLFSKRKRNSVRLLRHATLVIQIGEIKFLVDPMLSPKDAMDPIANAGNDFRIPMVPLPLTDKELNDILQETDAILITHTHRDHWDVAAQNLLAKGKTIFCQPSDAEKIRDQGFLDVIPVEQQTTWKGISIFRTSGRHGTGEVEKRMGKVSGFVLAKDNQNIYIAGDTIFCDEVKDALKQHAPQVIVANAGAPQYVTGGGPITMDERDIISLCRELPQAKVIAVHMETINHCTLTRAMLRDALKKNDLLMQVSVPSDGEVITIQ